MPACNPSAEDTVGQLVRERPERSRLFEELRVDYCCGGALPLEQACRNAGLDTDDVLRRLAEADAFADARGSGLVDADALGLEELCDHIEATHHAYLRRELPRLDNMTAQVLDAHGQSDPRLRTARATLLGLADELTQHMFKEEQILFPMIRQLERAGAPQQFHCGSVANPIRVMEMEHESAGGALAKLNAGTDGYQPPDWACNTYRALLDGLRRLEEDLHQHIHKENNVLFPKAIALEQCRSH